MKKKLISLLLCLVLFAALFCGALYCSTNSNEKAVWYFSSNCEGKLNSLSHVPKNTLTGYDSLMIVAHPDDETIWGGSHLLNGNYVVVCITNGNNKTRRREFESVIKQTGSIGIMLTYPDKTLGKRDNWNSCKTEIEKDVAAILKMNDWQTIVTHNPEGEYGHIHHQMTSELTTTAVSDREQLDRLYYFGKYVKAKNMDSGKYKKYLTNAISGQKLDRKMALTTLYGSQKKVMDHLGHMLPYENWTPASPSASQH